jgi:copper(I)-binding protein
MRTRRQRAAWIFAVLVTALAKPAAADVPAELAGDVRIEAAMATPGPEGGRSEVRFRIVNNSRVTLHLLGISTPLANTARLVARIGVEETATLQSIGVGSEEILDLTTSHLHYEISPLQRSLQTGETFPVTFNFVGWSDTIPAHVH